MSDRVFILGAGRVGLGLARALRAAGVELAGVHGHRAQEYPVPVSAGSLPPSVASATIVVISVRDAQIDAAVAELMAAPLAGDAVLLHTSGSADPASLAAARARGHAAGTFHPIVPFSDPMRAPQMLCGAWVGVDGDPAAMAAARQLAAAIGSHVLEIPAGEKARYHAACVIASNFPGVLLALGEQLLRETGVPGEIAGPALRPLFFAAVDNLRRRHAGAALTGPVVRGDVETVARHLRALAGDPVLDAVYRALSLPTADLALESGTDAGRIGRIRALLAER